MFVNCSGAVILSLLRQPIARKIYNPSVMWILSKRIIHVGNGGNQIIIGCILKPLDNRLLSQTSISFRRGGLLLFAYLFGGFEADLRKNFMGHGKIRISLECL